MRSAIEVRIWGKQVGGVAFDPQANCYVFSYAKGWLKEGIELSPLRLPTRAGREIFAFPELSRLTFSGLPGMLSDALPDNWGNALVDAYLLSKGIPKASVTVLDRLSYMGKRGMGALEFKPTMGGRPKLSTGIRMQSLVEEARLVVQGFLTNQELAKNALSELIDVGSSAGGARAKAVVAWNETTGELRSGQFEVPAGFEHWLLKFDGMGRDADLGGTEHYGRIEYTYHLMAKAAGIQMTRCQLLEENGRAHFMTRRFDRDGNQKHHIQTLCGMDHLDFRYALTHSYGQAFVVLAKLGLGADARDELFRRMAFNVMARNCDDHTKNIAFILKQGEGWTLAPAYDVIFAHNPKGEWTAHHQMSVNGRFDEIGREDLLLDAERFGIRRPAALLADVRSALASFGDYAREAGLPDWAKDEIARQFRVV